MIPHIHSNHLKEKQLNSLFISCHCRKIDKITSSTSKIRIKNKEAAAENTGSFVYPRNFEMRAFQLHILIKKHLVNCRFANLSTYPYKTPLKHRNFTRNLLYRLELVIKVEKPNLFTGSEEKR